MKKEEYKKIISNAISREVESYTFYRTISDKVKDKNLKTIFTELAGEETKHRQYLEGLISQEPKALHFDESRNYKIAEAMETPKLSANLKPIDGLVISIRKELEAMQMYTQLANLSTKVDQKKMFEELAKMETGHKARLEDIYTNMAFPEVW